MEQSCVIKLEKALHEISNEINVTLDNLLMSNKRLEGRVVEAMRYSSLSAGKRLRPFLVMQTGSLFNVNKKSALYVGAAIEMVHCYSLIHDDLPAMDNDDLRRGQATCHIKFDEASAILAGDALLSKAFEVLADKKTHESSKIRIELVSALARASGHCGMVGGQMIDLIADGKNLKLSEVSRLQKMKTGALISCAVEFGAILGEANQKQRRDLMQYAADIGLAFQIADDLLDFEGDESQVGKKTRKDSDAGKVTFVSLLGADMARAEANACTSRAIKRLSGFGDEAEILREVARYIVARDT